MGDHCRRRRPSPPHLADECGVDRISCLPDELLHHILLCLNSVHEAARTSVLSRCWRRVWTSMPVLLLSSGEEPVPSFLDTVDAVLAAYSAPAVDCLSISMVGCHGLSVPAHRVAPWLRFASQRVAGELCVHVSVDEMALLSPAIAGEEAKELELPACGTATSIELRLDGSSRLRPTGLFAALTELLIRLARMEGGDVSALVSTQCPRLKKLDLLLSLVDVFDISIHSDSLESVYFLVPNVRVLEDVAPKLEELIMWSHGNEARISAPKIANLTWQGDCYDPRRNQFAHICHRLRFLQILLEPSVIPLMEQFDEVDILSLGIYIHGGIAGYASFLNETSKLSKCETLRISLAWNQHGMAPAILHLLRCCNSIKKFSTKLIRKNSSPSLVMS